MTSADVMSLLLLFVGVVFVSTDMLDSRILVQLLPGLTKVLILLSCKRAFCGAELRLSVIAT